MASKSGDFSQMSYIFGVISIVMAFFTPMAGFVFGVIGFIQSKKEKTPISKKARKLNVIGMILSIVLFVITVLVAAYAATQGINLI